MTSTTTGRRPSDNPMIPLTRARALLPDVKRMNCGILGLSPDHTGPLVYYSDAALAIKTALASCEPAYDRELIVRMLTEYNHGHIGQFSPVAVEHQIKLLREAENHSAEGVGTARIHTCSHQCDRPACIRAQRDELATANERLAARIAAEAAHPAAGGVSEEQVREALRVYRDAEAAMLGQRTTPFNGARISMMRAALEAATAARGG